ncbi:hypothetical protein [Desulfococcus sp.]|uniref:hypothetical protein n=1 Tax=Desulfococcus sp. TaxID=2025834 RepID=UPI0035930945
MQPVNEKFMQDELPKAREGLYAIQRTVIFPNMILYRFGSSDKPKNYYSGSWWIGYSPFESLKKYGVARNQSLKDSAAQCLAIGTWNKCDVLIKVITILPLAAWSGTPKVQAEKIDKKRYTGVRRNPDRDITQLYIPGLKEVYNNIQMIWETALKKASMIMGTQNIYNLAGF